MTPLSKRLFYVPPFICAVIAANRVRKYTHTLIASRSKLSLRMVKRLAARVVWDGVDVDVASDYAVACGVDLFQPSKVRRYMADTMRAKNPLPHLSGLQRTATLERIARWVEIGKARGYFGEKVDA